MNLRINDHKQSVIPRHPLFDTGFRREGVEVDGKVMSLSTAAVYCMRQYGSNRETANGWIHWKTEDGTYLADLYNKMNLENINHQEAKG